MRAPPVSTARGRRSPRQAAAAPSRDADRPQHPQFQLGDAFVGETLHLFHVPAFDPQEAGRSLTARRVQISLVIKISHAGREPIFADRPRLTRLAFAGAGDRLVIGHNGLAGGLAVDRPRGSVIVRLAVFGAVIDVAQDTKAEFRVFVQDFAVGHVIAQVLFHEFAVFQHLADQGADLLTALDTRIPFEDAMTFGRKLFERGSNGCGSLAAYRNEREIPKLAGIRRCNPYTITIRFDAPASRTTFCRSPQSRADHGPNLFLQFLRLKQVNQCSSTAIKCRVHSVPPAATRSLLSPRGAILARDARDRRQSPSSERGRWPATGASHWRIYSTTRRTRPHSPGCTT